MRAARVTGPSTVEIVEVDEPELLPGSLVVEIARCAVGGSDHAGSAAGEIAPAAWFGHSWAGRVVAVGPDTTDHFEGERVVGAAPPPCGTCRACAAGFGDQCATVLAMIVGADPLASAHGAFAERIRVDARRVRRTPEGIDDAAAALTEPAAVAAHAIDRGGVRIGDLVLVIGAGTIGLVVAELARVAGAARVVVVDPEPAARELACDLGSDAAYASADDVGPWLRRHGHGLGADVAFDCVGAEGALAAAMLQTRRGGTTIAVGLGSGQAVVPDRTLVSQELSVRGTRGYTTTDVQRVLDLVAEDRLRLDPLIRSVIPLDELAATLAAGPGGSPPAILVDPQRR